MSQPKVSSLPLHPPEAEAKHPRASKACSSCRSRKVRCDVLQVGVPCSNCRGDHFECAVQDRKKRRRKDHGPDTAAREASSAPRAMPEHIMLHQVPHYPFFRSFNPRGRPWLRARQAGSKGVLLPVPAHDPSAPSRGPGPDDLAFLKQRGALELPSKEALDHCVSSYFGVFHSFFPVIDKPSFLKQYRECDRDGILQGRGASLLLLQAILFTASSTVPEHVIREMGFGSRKHAKGVLYARAKYLHTFDYEPDDIVTIQALLLLSHHYPSMVDQRHTWYWVHQAIGLAQGAGLHRDPGHAPERKLWARVWWACLVRDRLIALGTGRPMHINSLDCSVPPLTALDLEEEGDSVEDRVVKAVFVEFVKLCQYMEGVLSLPLATADSAREQVGLCESTLHHWVSNLSPAARLRDRPALGGDESSIPTLYKILLHLVYNVVLVSLHQSGQTFNSNGAGSRTPSTEVQSVAGDSIQLMEILMKKDLVRLCPTQCVTTVLPPLLIQLFLIRHTPDPDLGYEMAVTRFQTCMEFLKQLGDIYWHASFYHDFLELAASSSQPASQVTTDTTNALGGQRAGHSSNRRPQKRDQEAPGMATEDPEVTGQQEALGASTASPVACLDPSIEAPNVDIFSGHVMDTEGTVFGDHRIFENWLGDHWLEEHELFRTMFPSA